MLTGTVAEIKWHHYTAAAVNGYTVSYTREGGYTLTATVVMRDAFKMAQRPLTFEAPHKAGRWRWPILAHTITEPGRLTATLGPELTDPVPPGPPKDLCLDF